MNKLFPVLAALCLLSFAAPALAQTASTGRSIDCENIDVGKYTTDQIENLRSICRVTAPAAAAAKVTPQDVREWASLGREFSTAVVETAKGLGVAVNDFVYTPVGMMIAFYFMWDRIGGVVVGVPLLVFVIGLYLNLMQRFKYGDTTYTQVPVLWGAFQVNKLATRANSDNEVFSYWLMGGTVITFILCALILGVLIF